MLDPIESKSTSSRETYSFTGFYNTMCRSFQVYSDSTGGERT